ncbi:hypothetical protein [Gelidibacter salicanalis]|uniref:Uncharacterized protein n=1 Tax=Gelidibacter salicanalis TaxID=291193 RepID=A0A934KX46_9FLAO|nr:hypothetical protein [Gelidibacter salicanalis]MBJ7880930.1 hypothetical protein [Gelidibacter salicanalis]
MEDTTAKKTTNSFTKKKSFKLIEGKFEPAEAADVLFSILHDKIRFHNVQRLSIKERFNGDTSYSEGRLKDLKKSKKKIAKLIVEARDNGYNVEINSIIEMILTK